MKSNLLFNRLFVFEIANNHMGDTGHGLKIIHNLYEITKDYPDFKFAVKFQYRELNTFIHPSYQQRMDLKYIKRFKETELSASERKLLKDEAQKLGFITICTPFDEPSVDLVEEHDYDIIKIASCSFTDWPLLERIALTSKPLIASTASASLEEIDRVVTFLEHRNKEFCLMHCVGEYPTPNEHLQLNQIDLLKNRYPEIPIGFSTHESPENYDAIKLAIAKGATVFEKHVALKTDLYGINAYSATPENVRSWLNSAIQAYKMCGLEGKRYQGTEKEKKDLKGLQRGIFAKCSIKAGEPLDGSKVFFAIPNTDGQFTANDMSKYVEFIATDDIEKNAPITTQNTTIRNLREQVLSIVKNIKKMLVQGKIALPDRLEMEISHHYGIDKFYEWGATIINCINREYCKKLIILMPGQRHPAHFHKQKEETFHVLSGQLTIKLNGEERVCKAGDMVIVERGVVHSFRSDTGAIFEEVSTTHYKYDSFYEDKSILANKNRKTHLTFWADWLEKPLR